jgi:hypothetical protein
LDKTQAMTESCLSRSHTTVWAQRRRWWAVGRSRALAYGLLIIAAATLTGAPCRADDSVPSWLRPLTWTNPESSNTATTPPPLPEVNSPYLKPMRLRNDVKVPQQQSDFSAEELDFKTVSQPFLWANPQDSFTEPDLAPLTDDEQIEFEKQHFAWIRPFYWNNDQEAEEMVPLEMEYLGTSRQKLSNKWMQPFLWTNTTRPRVKAKQSTTPAPTNDSWLARSSMELYRLPPVDRGRSQLVSPESEPRTIAYMFQGDSLPAPTDDQGSPVVHPEPDSDAEDLADGLPFDQPQDGEEVLGEGFIEGAGGGIIADAETLGSEPEDNYSLQFLRADTVLLKPGEMQFDYGVTYTLADTIIPAVNGSSELEHARFRQRELLTPLEIRYGFTRRVQLFVNVPFGWSNIELALSDFELFENDGGLGDIVFGSTFLLREGNNECSDIVLTLAASAPTGLDPLVVPAGQPGVPSLGNGTWSMSANLLHIRTYDPMVVFYGFGTRQHFTRDLSGHSFRPGQEYNYQMGIGFAVNSKMTLSTRFSGAYVTEPRLDGQRFLGTIREPMSISMAVTIAQRKGLIEPFVDFGLTDESIQTRFGVVWTRF